MTEVNINPIDTPQFKNGDNIHFDYTDESSIKAADMVNSSASSNKKKKKRKKNKPKVDPAKFEATLNNPEDDYPTSRVIKQAPNGDVIVESLDDVPLNSRDHYEHHDHHHDHIPHANIWDNATIEEQENLKAFWESLDDSQKLELVKVDKKSIMDIFKSENKSVNHNASTNPQQNNGCSCSYCGKKNNIIEDELENIYDNHFDDIIDFIHEVRDINDLNALPGLLFGGFHMLEEEHKLHKRQQKFKNKKEHILNKERSSGVVDQVITKDNQNKIKLSQGADHVDILKSEKDMAGISNKIEINDIRDISNLRSEEDNPQNSISEQEVFNKLLDPKLTEALEGFDLERMKETETLAILLQRANSLREMIKDLHKADKDQLEKGMAFLQNMGKIINGDVSDQISQGLSKFAEDLLKNDGNSFIEMMESLSESRTEREDLLKESIRDESAWVDEDDRISEIPKLHSINIPSGKKISNDTVPNDQVVNQETYFKSQVNEEDVSSPVFENDVATSTKQENINELSTTEVNEYSQRNDLIEEKDDDDYYEEDEEYEDDEDDFEKEDRNYVQLEGSEEEEVSDTESEISEEEKMQEIRRLFLIQVIKLFQERLKTAYKEKLAEDRTKRLIEELEAEENAKKEKELKKLKQKEKAKEKKRLQQLAKEEERKKKEDEQRERELELQRKQEELRATQRRKKEEAKQKREEEKKKRIEELKRKEEEQRKKAEAQRKKEEEAKRLKEERKKKLEEERKRKEEEKRQKDLERKQEEEKRRNEKELLAQRRENERQPEADLTLGAFEVDQSFDELLNIQNVTEKLSNTELDDPLPVEEKSPSKNHLLEQLYLAKPGSFSSAPKSINPQFAASTNSIMPSLLSPSPSHILPNNMLPSQTQVHNNDPSIGNWSNHNAINTQPLFNNLYASNTSFSPFDGFPSNNGPSLNTQNGLTSTVWNQPSNSIWGNTNTNSTPLWNSVNNHTSSIADTEAIQSAAFNAYQLLQDTHMLEFGAARCITLFQNTKTLLNSELTLNQFLSACRTSSRFTFDLIYNNFGTVTHVKVSSIAQNQPIGTSAPELVNGLAPLNNFNTSDSGNLLNGFNDINDPAFSGVRNLWN